MTHKKNTNSIIVANESVIELQRCLLQKKICKNALQRTQSKIEMELNTKGELESKIDCLLLKKAKLSKSKL